MGFLAALQELVSVVLACEAVVGNDKGMTEEYRNTLDYILSMPSDLTPRKK